jgi:hypothetical protein
MINAERPCSYKLIELPKYKYMSSNPCILEHWFGGTCEYSYDSQQQIHHYLIKNDDIGFMDMTVTNECFMYESFDVRMTRMCEEYLAYMEYKYRDYIRKEKDCGRFIK